MSWRTKRTNNARIDRRKRLLRIESLESRHLLSAVVNIVTTGFPAVPSPGGGTTTPVAGDLLLKGDLASSNVQMSATARGPTH